MTEEEEERQNELIEILEDKKECYMCRTKESITWQQNVDKTRWFCGFRCKFNYAQGLDIV